jgi:hypothetical protein
MCNIIKTLLKNKSIKDLKKDITTGNQPYFITPRSMVFEYYLRGHAKQYELLFADAAEMLYHRGLITDYINTGESTRIFKKVLHTFVLRNGAPSQLVDEVELTFSQLELTQDDVIHIVANWEYDITGGFMGLTEYTQRTPVRRMSTNRTKGVPTLPGQSKVIEIQTNKAA